jgi:hypothetical protein
VRLPVGRQGWFWRNGANCNFFGGVAKAFRARKELKLAFRLDFLLLFDQAKRK